MTQLHFVLSGREVNKSKCDKLSQKISIKFVMCTSDFLKQLENINEEILFSVFIVNSVDCSFRIKSI